MIFVTVGTQLPFPRLIDEMERLAADLGEEVIAQTGPYEGPLSHMQGTQNMAPEVFERNFTAARVVVAHAGIGSILSAKRYGKPLVVLPRRLAHGEHRNDHQLATARAMEAITGVHVAWEAGDIAGFLKGAALEPASEEMSASHANLVARLRAVID